MKFAAYIALPVALACWVGGARAQTQEMSLPEFAGKRLELRSTANEVRTARCRGGVHRFGRPAYRIPRSIWGWNLTHWRGEVRHARNLGSACNLVPAFPWGALASCESGRNWTYNGSSGFDGGFQFLPSTWNMAKGAVPGASAYGYAYQAPAYVQYRVARSWQARTSWAQWPACAARLGLL